MRHNMQVRVLAAVIVGICLLATSDLSAQMRSSARSGRGGARDSYGASVAEDIMFEYDQETGSLIVITDEETNQHIQRIVESLDRPVPQVLIKVLFLEVTHGDALDLGVEGLFEYDSKSDDDKDIVETAFGLAAETQGGFFRIIEEDLEVTIRAIAEVAKLEVLLVFFIKHIL